MSENSYIINEIESAMSFHNFTTVDSEWGAEDDDESDFGEFSSASPKSDGLVTANHPITATNPSTLSMSNRFGQPTHFVRCTNVNSCGEIRLREPNGYVSGQNQKILPPEDSKCTKTTEFLLADSQFEISYKCTGDVQTITDARGCEICVGHPELCVSRSDSEISDSIPTSCTDPHSSAVIQNCQSLSAGDDRMMHSCTDTEKSLNCVDGLSVLSGSKLIGSVQSDLGRAKPDCNCTGSASCQDSRSSSEWVSNTESSLPKDVQVNSENSCTHADCVCETCEFDDFQSVLHADDFQERNKPTAKQGHSWASFGDVGVGGDCDNTWLAFQDIDLETGTLDDPQASQTVDSHLTIIPPSCEDDTGKPSDNFSQSETNKKKNVREILELIFPTSASACDEKPSSISGTSHGLGVFRPDLLDLIGEQSAINPKHSSGPGVRSSSSAVVWNSLKVMEDTEALKFHWNGSRSNRLLLKSVAMESPTRLNARRIQKQPATKTVQEVPDHRGPTSAAVTCRQPYESSFSQTVLSVTHLRM